MTELDEVTSPMARGAMEAGGVPTRPATATEVSQLGQWLAEVERRATQAEARR